MARRGVSRRFVRPPKKTVMWIGNTAAATPQVIAANTAVLYSVLNATALALRPFTVMRSRGFVTFQSDQVVQSEDPHGAYGEIVVTTNATTAGVASIPDPLTEPEASWYVYVPTYCRFSFATAVGRQDVMGQANVFQFDSKAMRKVGIDDDLAGVWVNGDATFGADAFVNGRTLIQLH